MRVHGPAVLRIMPAHGALHVHVMPMRHVNPRLAVEIQSPQQYQHPIKDHRSEHRRERQVHRPQHLVEKFKHAPSFHPWEAGLKTTLTMLVAQSSRHYKNTKCLAALLENDGAFVTGELFFYRKLSGFQDELLRFTGLCSRRIELHHELQAMPPAETETSSSQFVGYLG